jgi:bile acid-coenzyme A ligase
MGRRLRQREALLDIDGARLGVLAHLHRLKRVTSSQTQAPAADLPHHTYIKALASTRADEIVYRLVREDDSERTVTGAWLSRRAQELAGALAERGVGLGDRVSIGLKNSPELAIAVYASYLLGAVPIPVRWDVPDWELQRVLEVIEPKVHFGGDDLAWIEATDGRAIPELPEVISPHLQGICSSGSTGTPKVILSSMPAILTTGYMTPMGSAWMSVPTPQTILVPGPMYHVNAFVSLHYLLGGDKLVVLEKFDGTRALRAIENHGVTTFIATPTMLQRMADSPEADERDLSSLVWILQGAASLPTALFHRWAELIGPEKIVMSYGMTEGIGGTGLNGVEYLAHEGSVGPGLRGTELKILDVDGRELPHGEIGDIYMRSTMQGGSTYLGKAPNLQATGDGFLSVGDMGYLDADGYLYLVDRRVDMIITGGANVFPAEVEAALIDHPAVADVVVVGLKDDEWGRRVHAIIEPINADAPPSFDEIRQYAKGKLASYKVPKSIEIVNAMPRSAATKINRGRLVAERGG